MHLHVIAMHEVDGIVGDIASMRKVLKGHYWLIHAWPRTIYPEPIFGLQEI